MKAPAPVSAGAGAFVSQHTAPKEALNKSPNEMKGKAHGTQRVRHNMGLGEPSSTAQRSHSFVQAFMHWFPNGV